MIGAGSVKSGLWALGLARTVSGRVGAGFGAAVMVCADAAGAAALAGSGVVTAALGAVGLSSVFQKVVLPAHRTALVITAAETALKERRGI